MRSRRLGPDVVFYWSGGREQGEWRPATIAVGKTAEDVRRELNRAGFVAHPGFRSIGAPEGAPEDAEFRRLGL